MSTTEKAGTSLPSSCPELELFIKAQAHVRAAARIIDETSVFKAPHLSEHDREDFRDEAEDIRADLWDLDSKVQDLMSAYLIPLFPITDK